MAVVPQVKRELYKSPEECAVIAWKLESGAWAKVRLDVDVDIEYTSMYICKVASVVILLFLIKC